MIEWTDARKAKLLRITDYYGHKQQVIVGVEELAELTQALTKHLRYGDHIADISEETADVYICLEEIKSMLNISDAILTYNIDMKLERQLERIRKGEKETHE